MIVSDIIKDAKEMLGRCDTETVYARLTDAITALSNKGDWNPLIGTMDICSTTDGRTITLPRDVEVPLAVNVGGMPSFFRNKWFEFHYNGPGSRDFSCGSSVCKTATDWAWDDQQYVPVIMDLVQPSYLVAIADLKVDLSQTIRIFGYDENGQWIRSQEVDGTWLDGFELPLNLLSSFPASIPVADTQRYFRRTFIPTKLYDFLSPSDHDLTTGAEIILTSIAAPIPTPFVNATKYYARKIDSTKVRLYTSRTNALTDTSPLQITSYSPSSVVRLSDRRLFTTLTKFSHSPSFVVDTGTTIEFEAASFPSPILANTNYFARNVDSTSFQVHASLSDSLTNTNAIDVTTPGSGITAKAKQDCYPITALRFTVSHNVFTGDLVQITSTGTLPAPIVSGISYYARELSSTRLTLHETLSDSLTGDNPIVMITPGSGTLTLVKSIDCTALTGTNNNIQTSSPHGLSLIGGDLVQFSTTGTYPTPITQGTVYRADPPSSASTFSLNTTVPAPVNITALGSGQLKLLISRTFTIDFTDQWYTDATKLPTSTAIRITSTGALPATNPQINASTDYYSRKISDTVVELYTTSAYSLDTTIRYSTTRSRTANVATLTTSVAHGLTTNDYLDIAGLGIVRNGVLATVTVSVGGAGFVNGELATLTDGAGNQATGTLTVAAGVITAITIVDGGEGFVVAGALAITAPSGGAGTTLSVATVTNGVATPTNTFNGERIQITVTSPTTFTYASTGLNVAAVADIGGTAVISSIKVTALGTGNIFANRYISVSSIPFSSQVKVFSDYLKDGALVQFETSGSLPTPLLASTNYLVVADTNNPGYISFTDAGNSPVVLTSVGSGSHTMVISQQFSVNPINTYEVLDNNYNNGDAATASTTGTLPSPLTNTTYYIRRISDDTIELYDTSAHAIDTASTTGRVVATNIGSGTHTLIQTLNAFSPGKITRIQKPVTQGYVHLYAMDNGRSTDLTKIGFYYPDEIEPSYRRIRVPSACDWVRLKYRRRTFTIKSDQDYIPLTSRLAITFMLRALQLMRDNFLQEGLSFEAKALQFLSEEEASQEGPDSISVQFNSAIMTGANEMEMM